MTPLTDADLIVMERLAFASETAECHAIQRLLAEVRRLRHELADPNYMYAGTRIHRHALLDRNARLDRKRAEEGK